MNEPASGTARAAAWLAGALTRWPRAFLGLMMLIGVAINIANVIGRYLFNAPLFWAEEVLVYMMIWAVFIGLPAIVVDNAHLRMDLFYNLMGPRLKRAVDGLMTLLAPNVTWTADSDGKVSAARRPVYGPDKVGRLLLGLMRGIGDYPEARADLATYNSAPEIGRAHV